MKKFLKFCDKWAFILIWNKSMLIFAALLLGLLVFSAFVAFCKDQGQSKTILDLACGYMFDSSQVSGWTWLIFIVLWLFGDGILITIIVKHYYDWLNGDFRHSAWLVKKHIVVLGWDNGILTELRKEKNKKKDIYVVTRQKVSDLRKYLENAGLENVVVYRGDYDNLVEWNKKLKISKADQVFIAGELDEDAHDARVKLLYDKLKKENKIKANIHDFGLAWKLKDNTSFENFHLKWANYLWNRLEKEGKIPKSEKSDLFLDLYIVGFGAMGKSIVLTMPKAFLNAKNYRIIISGEDAKDKIEDAKDKKNKVKEEFERYKNQFNDGPKVEEPLTWSKFLEEIGKENTEQYSNNNIRRIVVVAEKRSEKGMYCMMDIISKLNDKKDQNLTLALSQEIDGYVTHGEEPSLTIGEAKVILFGMKKGCLNEPENTSK